jgi:hypothetical protein
MSKKESDLVLSIRINLPEYYQWRPAVFAKQYPYMALAIVFAGLLALGLLFILLQAVTG